MATAIALAGCGQSGPLVPAPGTSTPPAAARPVPAPLPPGAQRPTDEAPPSADPIKR